MPEPFVDTDVIVRLVSGDDPLKQQNAMALFERVERGEIVLAAPATVISDAAFVLHSPRLYGIPRRLVADALSSLVLLPGFQVENRRRVLRALQLYADHNVDFGDAYIAASMEHAGATEVYSYDHDFDRFSGIRRLEPS